MSTADGPFPWFRDSEMVVENADESNFDLGVDVEGSVLVHHDGHCKTIGPYAFKEVFDAAGDEYLEAMNDDE